MITRLQTPSMIDYVKYIFGADPLDIWEFRINDEKYRFVNGWRSGAKLYKNDALILEENKMFHLNSNKPYIETEVGGKKIAIYMKAIVSVKIRVAVDGQFMQVDYI